MTLAQALAAHRRLVAVINKYQVDLRRNPGMASPCKTTKRGAL